MKEVRIKDLTEEDISELYSFIVDSNLEWSFVNQLNDKKKRKKFMKWFQL